MTLESVIRSHKEIAKNDLNQIIKLKGQYWQYPCKSQLAWIELNIADDDYHLMLRDPDKNLLGYLNLINVNVNGKKLLGIGNVIVEVTQKKRGIGSLLMQKCLEFAEHESKDLVLLCDKKLVEFYTANSFKLYNGKTFVNGESFDKCVMFSDSSQSTQPEIHINKNF